MVCSSCMLTPVQELASRGCSKRGTEGHKRRRIELKVRSGLVRMYMSFPEPGLLGSLDIELFVYYVCMLMYVVD